MKPIDGKIEQVDKPWGMEQRYCENQIATVKILHITTGEMTSYQHHTARDEWIQVLKGMLKVTIKEQDEDTHILLNPMNEPLLIRRLVDHRFEGLADDPKNNGKERVQVLEVSVGKYFDDDIVRLADKYGRELNRKVDDHTLFV